MVQKVKSVELPTCVTLQYVEQGNPAGVPVLLLHGLSDSWHSYKRVLPHLPHSIRAFAVTLRGHGDASRPGAGYRFQDYSADIAAFLDTHHLDAAVIVGHSLGGSIAQRFAIDHPHRTLALILVAAFANLPKSPVPRELWEVVATMEDPVDQGFVQEFQQGTLAQPVPQAFFETIMQESLKLPAGVWRVAVKGSLEGDFSRELNRIKAPTLLVWGDQDEMVSRNDVKIQMEVIPDSRFIIYPGAGHGLHWEEPERFAADLVAFIDTLGQ